MSTKRALTNTEEQDARERGMPSTEASTLEDPLALEVMMRANTVEHKLNPKLPPDVAKMHVGLDDERKASREEARRRREICHGTVITDMDGAFARNDAQVRQPQSAPASPPVPTAAPTPPELL